MLMGIFGAILPRFVLLVGWVNDPTAWTSLFGAPVWFLFGFLFFPWTTLDLWLRRPERDDVHQLDLRRPRPC